MLIDVILVVGIYVFVGNSGVFSFGHIGFMAIGVYSSALLTIPVAIKHIMLPELPTVIGQSAVAAPVAALVAALVAGVIALIVAAPVMRLSGLAASISTFAFLVIVQIVFSNWDSVTLGNTTMIGVPADTTVVVALLWTLVAMAVAFAFQNSIVGIRLRTSREDEVAARAIGVGVYPERVVAFVASAMIVAVGGALYAGYVGAFSPSDFYTTPTIVTAAMLVIGGTNSLAGAVIGAVVVTGLTEILRSAEAGISVAGTIIHAPTGLTQVGLGLAMLLILIYRPRGLTGGNEVPNPWHTKFRDSSTRRSAAAPSTTAPAGGQVKD
jgi:branched-chain amino acid transport system permease protein